ncbi:hypothetical protein [Erinnyis ello granulovirus]|uniref:P78/83 n=1 Tax=Erinnyis ello granulovirus TaxID=307444 RepID=A0A097DAU8_9BBAC|nr:hypothetical protein [Erinnyis ello granulovirus]AIS92131.1 hypothetical protein [Erinnyis ello granulovirus]ARX71341.1 hypothetical protein EREL_002 [Erinnyis ello granulovirus]ARX71471.1 hypothetical protein EREL_002 [Erinnyis ello granulovirus]ARX71601.1 hypothetical protein EREL_002 [Erinnyis ello granulovirus]ARX71731.1 hypothetical protein EREL_002 [Erinnyis ello granulovirus]
MDLLGFIRANKFNADVRDTIKYMKWNNSLKRKLNAKTDVIEITTEELVEFMESVYQMIVKKRVTPCVVAEKAPVTSPSVATTPAAVVNEIQITVNDKDTSSSDYDVKIVDTD